MNGHQIVAALKTACLGSDSTNFLRLDLSAKRPSVDTKKWGRGGLLHPTERRQNKKLFLLCYVT